MWGEEKKLKQHCIQYTIIKLTPIPVPTHYVRGEALEYQCEFKSYHLLPPTALVQVLPELHFLTSPCFSPFI